MYCNQLTVRLEGGIRRRESWSPESEESADYSSSEDEDAEAGAREREELHQERNAKLNGKCA
jgi:hypothetical protein